MTLIRKIITFVRTTDAAFFDADGHPGPDESDLDFYNFDREARMDEVWGSVRGVAVGRMGSDRIQPSTEPGVCGVESENHPVPKSHLMQENGEMMELNKHLTDVEIMRAVRYLDPDSYAERTRNNAGSFVGICITLLTGLISAITYICLYVRKL